MSSSFDTDSDDVKEYIDQVFDRAEKAIDIGIWDSINKHRLRAWSDCLDKYDAKLLGAYLLDNLCCRSRKQFRAMLDVLFRPLLSESSSQDQQGRLINTLSKKPGSQTPKVLFAPVIGLDSPPTKSGPYILRLAQRQYNIHSNWLTWPQHLNAKEDLNCLYFVDDFCGTGTQFIEFSQSIQLSMLNDKLPKLKIVYLVTTIHVDGLKNIKEQLPFIHIQYAELLIAANTVFSDECFERYKIPGFKESIREQYDRVLVEAGLPTQGRFADGFGKLGLAYTFSHATPNNTLPIFWLETPNWTPLVDR